MNSRTKCLNIADKKRKKGSCKEVGGGGGGGGGVVPMILKRESCNFQSGDC